MKIIKGRLISLWLAFVWVAVALADLLAALLVLGLYDFALSRRYTDWWMKRNDYLVKKIKQRYVHKDNPEAMIDVLIYEAK